MGMIADALYGLYQRAFPMSAINAARPQFGGFVLTPDELQSYWSALNAKDFDPEDLIKTNRPDFQKYLLEREAGNQLAPLMGELGNSEFVKDVTGQNDPMPPKPRQQFGKLSDYLQGRPLAPVPRQWSFDDVWSGVNPQPITNALQMLATRYPRQMNALDKIRMMAINDPQATSALAYTTMDLPPSINIGPLIEDPNQTWLGPVQQGAALQMSPREITISNVLETLQHELTHAAMARVGPLFSMGSEGPSYQSQIDFNNQMGFGNRPDLIDIRNQNNDWATPTRANDRR